MVADSQENRTHLLKAYVFVPCLLQTQALLAFPRLLSLAAPAGAQLLYQNTEEVEIVVLKQRGVLQKHFHDVSVCLGHLQDD